MKGALEVLADVGIERIASRVRELGDHLIAKLEGKGYRIVSPRAAGQWSGIVSFVSPLHPHEPIVSTLRKEHHTEISLREGRLRCSPHFYNTIEQLDRLVDLLPSH
jgi:selenocysteine lyase/cysteine desulfurase